MVPRGYSEFQTTRCKLHQTPLQFLTWRSYWRIKPQQPPSTLNTLPTWIKTDPHEIRSIWDTMWREQTLIRFRWKTVPHDWVTAPPVVRHRVIQGYGLMGLTAGGPLRDTVWLGCESDKHKMVWASMSWTNIEVRQTEWWQRHSG